MIDLHKIGRTMFAKAEKPAAVIGVVTRSGADLKAVRNVLKAAGIDHSTFVKKSDEETTVYKAEGDHDGVMLLKMNDDFALAVSGLKKAFAHYDFDSKDFKSVHATNAFAASVTSALDSLRNTLANIMDGCKSPKEAAEAIDSAVDEFKSHVTTLVSNLPEKAMKADAELLKGAKAVGGCDDDQETGTAWATRPMAATRRPGRRTAASARTRTKPSTRRVLATPRRPTSVRTAQALARSRARARRPIPRHKRRR